jgi:hypothetical protein
VDVPALIDLLKSKVNIDYTWPGPSDIHHFYWPRVWYPYDHEKGRLNNPSTFRNLSISKGLVPRVFHNWLHEITLPPPVPKLEIMEYRIESWDIARSLLGKATGIIEREKGMRRQLYVVQDPVLVQELNANDIIDQEVMQDILEANFPEHVNEHLARLEKVPEDMWLFNPDQPPVELASDLSKLVLPSAVYLDIAA